MTTRVTITKAGRRDSYGIELVVGQTITVDDQFALDLVRQGFASDTDAVMGFNPSSFVNHSYSPNSPKPNQPLSEELAGMARIINGLLVDGAGNPIYVGGGSSSAGTPICDWQPAGGTLSLVSSNGGGEAIALDPTVLCDGLPMARVTCGNTGTLVAQYVFSAPITLAQMQSLQIPIRVSQNNAVFGGTGPVQIWLWDDLTGTRQWRLSTSLNMSRARPGATHVLSFGPGVAADGWAFGGTSAPTNTSDMDAYTIDRIRIVIAVPGSVAGEAAWLGPIRANSRRRSVVSIVLDGQYASQHQYLLPMIEAQGLRCSLALQYSLIGADAGRMTAAQLDRAYAAGHELIHHVYDGSKSSGYANAGEWPTAATITADINAGQEYMRVRAWTRGLGYMVHGGSVTPYAGNVTAARQQIVTAGLLAAGIKGARVGDGLGTAPLKRLQSTALPSAVDPLTIQGALQWTSTDNAAALAVPLTSAKARGEWAIYTGHRSVISTPGSLEITNADALTWLQALGDDVRTGKVLCLPFGEACRYYGVGT